MVISTIRIDGFDAIVFSSEQFVFVPKPKSSIETMMKKRKHGKDRVMHFVLVWVLPKNRRGRLNHDKELPISPLTKGATTMPEVAIREKNKG
jgi:hypothetical protein